MSADDIPALEAPEEEEERVYTRGELVIAFIHGYCKVPEGSDVGKPMQLAKFQIDFILDVYDNETATLQALLSIARKNGKTGLIAALLLAHLVGPEAVQNSQIVSGAMSREQASLVFKLAWKMIDLNPTLRAITKVTPSTKTIMGLLLNVEYRALSADGSTAHGLSPVLVILDEAGQVKGPTSAFVEALLTSQGAHDNPLFVAISTSSPSDADMFAMWIDDAIRSGDPHIVCHEYRADKDCDLLDEEQMLKANPAMGIFRNKRDLVQQLTKAERMPSTEAAARNLLLNQRISLENLWLAPLVWKANNRDTSLDVFRENPVSIGLDLSAVNDLTAAVMAAMDEKTDRVHLYPFVYTPRFGLKERALKDRAPYDAWVRDGHMFAVGNKTVDYTFVAEHLRDFCIAENIEPVSIEFDRWRIKVFHRVAEEVGFAESADWNEVGQGYKDFSPRCEMFMGLALDGRIHHGSHPLLTMAAANAIAVQDAAGSIKLDKSKSTQRIDPLVAAVMAVYPVAGGGDYSLGINHWII